jgi:hypothetical protein
MTDTTTPAIATITVKGSHSEAARDAAGQVLEERGFTGIRLGSAKATGAFRPGTSTRLWTVDYLADQATQGGHPVAPAAEVAQSLADATEALAELTDAPCPDCGAEPMQPCGPDCLANNANEAYKAAAECVWSHRVNSTAGYCSTHGSRWLEGRDKCWAAGADAAEQRYAETGLTIDAQEAVRARALASTPLTPEPTNTRTDTQWGLLYKGEMLGVHLVSEDDARDYIARAERFAKLPRADYQVVRRQVTITETPWVAVEEADEAPTQHPALAADEPWAGGIADNH